MNWCDVAREYQKISGHGFPFSTATDEELESLVKEYWRKGFKESIEYGSLRYLIYNLNERVNGKE